MCEGVFIGKEGTAVSLDFKLSNGWNVERGRTRPQGKTRLVKGRSAKELDEQQSNIRCEDSPNIFNDRRIWGVLFIAVFVYYVKGRTRLPQTWSGSCGLLSSKKSMKTRKGKDASSREGRVL